MSHAPSYHPRQIKSSFDLSLSYARALAGIFERKRGVFPFGKLVLHRLDSSRNWFTLIRYFSVSFSTVLQGTIRLHSTTKGVPELLTNQGEIMEILTF
jgi:hypothetical protein